MSEHLKKHEGAQAHQGPERHAPYPLSRLAPSVELVDLAKEIAHADTLLTAQAGGKLRLIAEQIRMLQDQAREILAQTRQDQALHRAQCSFKRIPGKIYHLYQRPDGSQVFSMLAPEEWRGQAPYQFMASYRLEADMTWTRAEDVSRRGGEDHMLQGLLQELKR